MSDMEQNLSLTERKLFETLGNSSHHETVRAAAAIGLALIQCARELSSAIRDFDDMEPSSEDE